jgi:hypothetical protein
VAVPPTTHTTYSVCRAFPFFSTTTHRTTSEGGCATHTTYSVTPMERYEYMKIHISKLPDEFIAEYDLTLIATPDGWVYMEVRKGMPGLKQAGGIANDRLTAHLASGSMTPDPSLSRSLWTISA